MAALARVEMRPILFKRFTALHRAFGQMVRETLTRQRFTMAHIFGDRCPRDLRNLAPLLAGQVAHALTRAEISPPFPDDAAETIGASYWAMKSRTFFSVSGHTRRPARSCRTR